MTRLLLAAAAAPCSAPAHAQPRTPNVVLDFTDVLPTLAAAGGAAPDARRARRAVLDRYEADVPFQN